MGILLLVASQGPFCIPPPGVQEPDRAQGAPHTTIRFRKDAVLQGKDNPLVLLERAHSASNNAIVD